VLEVSSVILEASSSSSAVLKAYSSSSPRELGGWEGERDATENPEKSIH
jgi:hypothetical protein